MGKGCGLKAVEAAKVGRRRRNQSYPQEDELSALLLCLLQFCYFKAFLEACQLLLCHLLHFFPMFEISKKKKRKTFLFFFPASVFLPLVHGSLSSASSPLGETGAARVLLGGHKLQQKVSTNSLALGRSCRKDIPWLYFEKDFSRLLPHSSSAVCPSGFHYEM